jgi:hypothetical protein
MSHQKRAHLRK